MLDDDARKGWPCYGRSYISVVDCVIAVCSLMYMPTYIFGYIYMYVYVYIYIYIYIYTQLEVTPEGSERN